MTIQVDIHSLRQEVVGVDHRVPLLDGGWDVYVNLDNAASTPPFRKVKEKVDELMLVYSSVHRGSGFKSLLSTHLYDKARQVTAAFVGADLAEQTVIFGKNTTEAINKLAHRFDFQPGDRVLTTVMEHHSNDLPWRAHAQTLHAGILPDGSLDLDDLRRKLEQYQSSIRLLAVTGASNVSGYLPPIYELAELAHAYGKPILVDCAQLLPHRKIQVGPAGSPRHLDFIALSGHKVYAPFGTGALVGPRKFFENGAPEYQGGGTIELVTLDEVQWSGPPDRDEAGSPNVIGAVALAVSLEMLSQVGMEAVAAHEAELTRYALTRLNALPFIELYGSQDPQRVGDRLGVIPFQVQGVEHALAAAVLGFEGGVGVRNGCFCAHPYVLRLLQVSDQEFLTFRSQVLAGDRSHLPGFIRASFGCYNNFQDVDRLVEMLERIAQKDYRGDYLVDRPSGSYYPRGFSMEKMEQHFNFV
jgi:selenocysteine lyase/cysteine desulfurase